MQGLRTGIGLVGALLPIAYCGWMVWYFADIGGWDEPVISSELRPTIIGLSLVGLLFVALLAFRARRLFARPQPPDGGGDPGDGSDADAMIARYLAGRAATEAGPAPAPPPSNRPPASFGRRARF